MHSISLSDSEIGFFVLDEASKLKIKEISDPKFKRLYEDIEEVFAIFYETGVILFLFIFNMTYNYDLFDRYEKAQMTHDVHLCHDFVPLFSFYLAEELKMEGLVEMQARFRSDCFCINQFNKRVFDNFIEDNKQKIWTHTSFFVFSNNQIKANLDKNRYFFEIDRHTFGTTEISVAFQQFVTGESAGEWSISGNLDGKDIEHEIIVNLSAIFLLPMQIRVILDSLRMNTERMLLEIKRNLYKGSSSQILEYIATCLLRVSRIKAVFNSIAAPYRKIFRVAFELFAITSAEAEARSRAGDVQVFVDAQNMEVRERTGNIISVAAIALSMISALSSIIAVFGFVGANDIVFAEETPVLISSVAATVCAVAFLVVCRQVWK
jgi:hypothetical protein